MMNRPDIFAKLAIWRQAERQLLA